MLFSYKEYLKTANIPISSNTLRQEIENTNAIDNRFVNNTMYRLADLLRSKVSTKTKEITEEMKVHVLCTINHILDSIVLEEFFDVFIDSSVKFFNQHYF